MRILGLTAFAIATTPAAAQYIDYNAVNVTSNLQVTMREAVAPNRGSARPIAKATRPPIPGATRDATDFSFRSTPELRRIAADQFIARTSKSDPAAGKLIAAQIAQQDFNRVYAGIIAPFGYHTDDAADALAAYTLLGWLIANGAPDPSRAAAAGVRRQVAANMTRDLNTSDPRKRAELAEELKLLFVTLHAGWQSARREGRLKPYGDGVAAMFNRFTGDDLRALRLTDDGFAQR